MSGDPLVDVPEIRGYGILGLLGTGARSVIYKAVLQGASEPVAIKWVPRRSRSDDRYLRQVENEWEVCSRLSHPNVVGVRELVRCRDLFWVRGYALVMEYIDGRPLATLEDLPLRSLLEYFIQTASALQHTHEQGYAHCDLKPHNILVRRDGLSVKLVDFGIASPLGSRRDRLQGTVSFIAPEQTEPGTVDRRTDIFNLGATMYRMLTGHSLPTTFLSGPGTSPQPAQLLWASITKINPEVPKPLADLVLNCTRRPIQERPDSADEVMQRLAAVRKEASPAPPAADGGEEPR
jgi:serine/threonine-protein kinase